MQRRHPSSSGLQRATVIALAAGWPALHGACTSEGELFEGRPVLTPLLAAGSPRATGAVQISRLQAAVADKRLAVFDGTVFDLGFGSTAFSPMPIEAADVADAMRVTRDMNWGSLRENFQWLSLGQVALDFGDSAATALASSNLETAARFVRDAGLRGFFIDNQMYGPETFSWNANAGESFAARELLVRTRGADLTAAILRGYPDVTLVFAWGFSEMYRLVCIAGQVLPDSRYALFPAFLEGVYDAVRGAGSRAHIIDGYLPAYPARRPEHFATFAALIHGDAVALRTTWQPGIVTHWDGADGIRGPFAWPAQPVNHCAPELATRLLRPARAGFGLMPGYDLDGFAAKVPAAADPGHQGFSRAVAAALRVADGPVWVYGQDFSWWDQSLPVPPGTVEAVAAGRDLVRQDPLGRNP